MIVLALVCDTIILYRENLYTLYGVAVAPSTLFIEQLLFGYMHIHRCVIGSAKDGVPNG